MSSRGVLQAVPLLSYLGTGVFSVFALVKGVSGCTGQRSAVCLEDRGVLGPSLGTSAASP